MVSKILTVAALSIAVALPAMAQQAKSTEPSSMNTPASSESSSNSTQANTMSVRQDIVHDLQKAGFKNIHLAPASFVAHATDSHGNPVVMAISPDSMTMITAMNPSASGSTKTASANTANSGSENNGK